MKTAEQMLQLRKTIMKQVERLPQTSAFGDGNAEDIAEMLFFCSDLKAAAEGAEPLSDETRRWIRGESSMLNDFLV